MPNERLELNMTKRDALMAICGLNPGALAAGTQIMQLAGSIDPDDAFGGLGTFMSLDRLNVWEDRMYLLWNDVCGRDLTKMIAVLRANQLGMIGRDAITDAIDNRTSLDVDGLLAKVKERLPRFGQVEVSA